MAHRELHVTQDQTPAAQEQGRYARSKGHRYYTGAMFATRGLFFNCRVENLTNTSPSKKSIQ